MLRVRVMEVGNNTRSMGVKLHDWSMIEVGHALCMHKKEWSFNFMVSPANLAFWKKNPLKYLQKSLSLKNCTCNLVATIAFSTLLLPYYSMCHVYGKKKSSVDAGLWLTHIFWGGNLCWKDQQKHFLFIQLQHIVLLTSFSPSQPPNEVVVRVPSQLSKIQNDFFPLDVLQQLNFLSVIKNVL